MQWEQIVYSLHFYSGADPLFSDEKGLADHLKRSKEVLRLAEMVQERHQVPVYFGEFSTMGNHANDIEGMRHFHLIQPKGLSLVPLDLEVCR